jgi:hypothetical protein
MLPNTLTSQASTWRSCDPFKVSMWQKGLSLQNYCKLHCYPRLNSLLIYIYIYIYIYKKKANSKGFWWWYITLRIPVFLDIVPWYSKWSTAFWKLDLFLTFGKRKESGNAPTWLGQLELIWTEGSQLRVSVRLVASHSVWNTRQWTKSSSLVVISEIQKSIVSHKAVVSTRYSKVS